MSKTKRRTTMSHASQLRSHYNGLAAVYDPKDMPKLFRGLKGDTRDTLYGLAMSRRGQRLIIGHLRAMHEEQMRLVREWTKRNAAPRVHKY